MAGIQLADPYATREMQRLERLWLLDNAKRGKPISMAQPEVADPAASKNMSGIYEWLKEDPDVAYRASLLPMVRTKQGGIRMGMPQAALDLARGAVDLLAGPETGVMTAQATGAIASLAGSSAMQAPQPGVLAAIKAYHGSPHRFDKFDMSKIGTGEGAQAYGHGLYFAEQPGVARQYRDDLTGMRVGMANRAAAASGGDFDAAITEARRKIDALKALPDGGGDPARQARQIGLQEEKIAELLAMKAGQPSSGALYHTTLSPDHEDLLDWDAPLSQQSPKVREALKPLLQEDPRRNIWNEKHQVANTVGLDENSTGRAIYERLAHRLDQQSTADRYVGPEEATRRLRELGIPGLRYLDAGSRTQGEGSRNIVLFDDRLVNIDRVE